MPNSKAKIAANNRYTAHKYDRIQVLRPKGERDRLKAVAAAQGKSLNQYVNDAIDAAEQEQKAGETDERNNR
jgi:predicted HicB family RNase H-like nuclease